MLSSMRSHAGGFFAKLLLGLLVLTFAIWGIGDIFRYGSNQPVAKVDNVRISQAEYQEALAREIDGFRRTLGDKYNAELIKSAGIEMQVLRQLVNSILIAKESAALDIAISNEQVVKKIKANPAFQNNRFAFDKALFQSALMNMRITEKAFVESLKVEAAGKIISDAVLDANLVIAPLTEAVYAARKEQRVADIFVINQSKAGALPTPTDEELKTYHSQHNREFTAPEYRNISYIVLDPNTLKGKVKLDPTQPAEEAVYQAAKDLEDELAGGATMEEAAAKFGLVAKKVGPVDAEGKDKSGKPVADLPKLNNFLKLAFSLDERDESPVTLSREGVNFIVRTDTITPEHVRPIEEVKAQVIAGWQKEKLAKQLYAIAQQTASELKETGATKLNIAPVSTGTITRDTLHIIRGESTPLPAPLQEEIFHLPEGKATNAYGLGNGNYAVAVVRKVIAFNPQTADSDKQKSLVQLNETLRKQYADELYAQYMNHLGKKYSITVDKDALKAVTSTTQ